MSDIRSRKIKKKRKSKKEKKSRKEKKKRKERARNKERDKQNNPLKPTLTENQNYKKSEDILYKKEAYLAQQLRYQYTFRYHHTYNS